MHHGHHKVSGPDYTDGWAAHFGGHRSFALRYGHGQVAETISSGTGGTFYDSTLYGHIGDGQHCRHYNVRKANARDDIADAEHDTAGSHKAGVCVW